MPGLDPRRIRRALRTPVIFLVAGGTAPRPRGLAVRRDTAGARRWLTRPFSPRQLVVLVREVLGIPGGTIPPRPPRPSRPGGPIPPGPPLGDKPFPPDPRSLRPHLTATESAVLVALMDNACLVPVAAPGLPPQPGAGRP